MSYLLSPIANESQIDENGNPLSGGLIETYIAGTTSATATFTDDTGNTPHTNPIVLNVVGLPTQPIWLNSLLAYKFIIKNSSGVVQRTIDNVIGVSGSLPAAADQWILYNGSPTYISTTSFSLTGDQTSTFQIGRRVRTINTGGVVYSTILTSAFAGVTTVTLSNDSGSLDTGLSQVAYGILSSINDSIPAIVAKSGYDTFTGVLELTTAGTVPNYTLAAALPLASYAAGQRFRVKFHAAGSINPLTNYTLNINSLGAKSILGQGPGGYFVPAILTNTIYDVEYDGAQFIVLNPLDTSQRCGEYIHWPINSTPTYALLCNGAAVSRSTYARLFKILGTAFGVGDGSTTFNLPNIPSGYALTNSNGSNAGTTNVGQNLAHTHVQTTYQIGGSLGNGGSAPGSGPGADANVSSSGGAANLAAGMYSRVCIVF